MAITLGRRYERLLLLSVPLTLLMAALVYFASASVPIDNNRECLRILSSGIDENFAELKSSFEKRQVVGGQLLTFAHGMTLNLKLMEHDGYSQCREYFDSRATDFDLKEPQTLQEEAEAQLESISAAPMRLYGIEVPKSAALEVLGTTVRVEVAAVLGAFQAAASPLLMIWLGCLYQTRYRETCLIGRAAHISEVFPHIVNFYLIGKLTSRKKRTRWPNLGNRLVFGFYAALRVVVVAMFTVPPAALFGWSLFQSFPLDFSWMIGAFAAACLFLVTGNLLLELLPWHLAKLFDQEDMSEMLGEEGAPRVIR